MSVQFFLWSKNFFISCYSRSNVFFLLQETPKSVFLPLNESLKQNHDTNFLMKCEDTFEDPLMSVQFYIKSKVFPFRATVHLLSSFFLQETLKSVFLVPYDSLKLNHITNYLMTSEDTVKDPLMSVQFYIKSKVFPFRATVHLLSSFLLQEMLKSVFLPPYS